MRKLLGPVPYSILASLVGDPWAVQVDYSALELRTMAQLGLRAGRSTKAIERQVEKLLSKPFG